MFLKYIFLRLRPLKNICYTYMRSKDATFVLWHPVICTFVLSKMSSRYSPSSLDILFDLTELFIRNLRSIAKYYNNYFVNCFSCLLNRCPQNFSFHSLIDAKNVHFSNTILLYTAQPQHSAPLSASRVLGFF